MVALSSLWLPIIVAAVIVFFASFVMHMLLKYHYGDYRQLPDEDKVLATLREAGVKPSLCVFPYGHAPGYEVASNAGEIQARTGGVHDGASQRPDRHGKVSGAVVRVLPDHLVFHGVCDGAHGRAGNGLSCGVSRGRHGGVHGLRPGKPGERHLEGPAVGHGYQRSGRRAGVRMPDGGNLWVAVAAVNCL